MTSAQLSILLDALPGPARVYNPHGMIMAQNALARGEVRIDPRLWQNQERHELGDGWILQTWNAAEAAIAVAAPDAEKTPEAASGGDMATLANSMAHSIRNPISSIVTAAKLLQNDDAMPEETRMLLDVIVKESHHLNKIVTDFLHFVRPQKLNIHPLEIEPLLRQAAETLQEDGALPPAVQVEYSLPENLSAMGDEAQLARAFGGILQNAAQMMESGGTLNIEGEVQDSQTQIRISDEGGGFSPEDLQRAFEPFYSNLPAGTGLGLAIARAAIERCGGSAHIENTEHNGVRGACVVITLQAA